MEEKKKLLSLNDFISGSIAGIVQVLLGQPFDIVKVRMQTKSDIYKSPGQTFNSILKNEGPLAFYKGTLSPLLGISFCVAIQFGSNSLAKNYLVNKNKREKGVSTLSVRDYIIAGSFAGLMNSFVISPIELIRIKLQVQGKADSGVALKYFGTLDCAKKIFSTYGIKGLYQGYPSTLAREVPAYAAYFGIYESLMGHSEKKYGDRKKIPKMNVLSYGAIAGIVLWLSSFPIDVIKSCMQADSLTNRKYPSIMSTIRTIHRENGLGGFFKGLTPCLMRAPPVNAATFFTFELVHEFLHKLK